MLDPNKSALLERVAAFVVIAIFVDLWWLIALPYISTYVGIKLEESDRAIVAATVGLVSNVVMLIVGYFFGATINRAKVEDTTNKALTLATNALAPPSPVPDKIVNAAPGETVAVTAEADPPNPKKLNPEESP